MTKSFLELVQVSKNHGSSNNIPFSLNDVSFAIYPNDRLAIFGPSGSGKSTLAKMIKGFIKQSSGKIYFEGKDTSSKNLLKNPSIQLIFQNSYESLSPRVKVIEQLLEPLQYQLDMRQSLASERVFQISAEFKIHNHLLQKFPYQLSGGERQRIALIRALLLEPKVLICDEILSSLDQPLQQEVMDLLLNYQSKNGLAILFITHDIEQIIKFCKNTLLLIDGRVVSHSSIKDLFNNSSEPFIQKSLSALEWFKEINLSDH